MIKATTPKRREDLVFVTNGLPSDFIQYFYQSLINNTSPQEFVGENLCNDVQHHVLTTSVPHFGVLNVGADPISISQLSPPTYIYGKHALKLKSILEAYDLNVKVTSTIMDIDAAAIRKLIWVSGMWLLCHDSHGDGGSCCTATSSSTRSINVSQVHETKNLLSSSLLAVKKDT